MLEVGSHSGATACREGPGALRWCLLGNFFSDNSVVEVTSVGNLYRGAIGSGVSVVGGIHFGLPRSNTSGNRTEFTSFDDAIEENRIGIDVQAGSNGGLEPYTTDRNEAVVSLFGTRFNGNPVTIHAVGSRALNLVDGLPGPLQGSDNRARLLVRRANFVSGGPILGFHAQGTAGGFNKPA